MQASVQFLSLLHWIMLLLDTGSYFSLRPSLYNPPERKVHVISRKQTSNRFYECNAKMYFLPKFSGVRDSDTL